jgi:hypothetical protein
MTIWEKLLHGGKNQNEEEERSVQYGTSYAHLGRSNQKVNKKIHVETIRR